MVFIQQSCPPARVGAAHPCHAVPLHHEPSNRHTCSWHLHRAQFSQGKLGECWGARCDPPAASILDDKNARPNNCCYQKLQLFLDLATLPRVGGYTVGSSAEVPNEGDAHGNDASGARSIPSVEDVIEDLAYRCAWTRQMSTANCN